MLSLGKLSSQGRARRSVDDRESAIDDAWRTVRPRVLSIPVMMTPEVGPFPITDFESVILLTISARPVATSLVWPPISLYEPAFGLTGCRWLQALVAIALTSGDFARGYSPAIRFPDSPRGLFSSVRRGAEVKEAAVAVRHPLSKFARITSLLNPLRVGGRGKRRVRVAQLPRHPHGI